MKLLLPSVAFTAVLAAASLQAQTAATDPVGAVAITLKGASDTVVAVPLTPAPTYSGLVASASAGAGNAYNISVSGTPGWTNGQFSGLFYVRVTSGTKAGMYYTVTGNTPTQLTLDSAGDNLAGLVAGDSFKVFRYWTLGTLFPPASAGTAANPLTPSTGTASFQRRSVLLLPDNASNGINLSAAGAYFFTSANGWVSAATGNPAANDTVLWPDSYFIVRQPSDVADASWVCVGNVATSRLMSPLRAAEATQQDNFVGLARPVDVRLADLGLETAFVESTGLASFQRKDLLLTFDNSVSAVNKAPTGSYFRFSGNWYSTANGTPLANDDVLKAGAGFIIRKAQNPVGSALWANNPTY